MFTVLLLIGPMHSFVAYIDPGTGMAFLYALGAMATGVAFQFRRVKQWVSSKLTRR